MHAWNRADPTLLINILTENTTMTTTNTTAPTAFTATLPVPGPIADAYGDGEGCETDVEWVNFAWTRGEMLGHDRCAVPRLTFRPIPAAELCGA